MGAVGGAGEAVGARALLVPRFRSIIDSIDWWAHVQDPGFRNLNTKAGQGGVTWACPRHVAYHGFELLIRLLAHAFV